jgi:carbamoyltransferase
LNLLGFAGLNHDPSAALLQDGRIRFAIESEKVTRHKHEITYLPVEAIELTLRSAGLALADLDYIVTNWDAGPRANGLYLRHLAAFAARGVSAWPWIANLAGLDGTHQRYGFTHLLSPRLPPIARVRHHLAHLGSCFTLSPFEEAAVLVVDGMGEFECSSLYHCQGRAVRRLGAMNLPHDSLGHVYAIATNHLGYRMNGDEYKVMGLAAYGGPRPDYTGFFEELIALLPEGRYRVSRRLGDYIRNCYRFPEALHAAIGPPRRPGEPIEQRHMDFALALQQRIEEAILHMARHLRQATGSRRLCLAGGVALNALANARVQAEAGFEQLFIQPAAADSGTSLGAAAYFHHHVLGRPRPEPMRHAYLGPAYDNPAIEAVLKRARAPYLRLDDPACFAARELAAGRIVGWFQGAAEFGPRALGNRSILADPRQAEMKDRVNQAVKNREPFRPFAPSLPAECAADYFVHIREAPFMLLAGPVRPERRAEIAAVVHVDGTARPQTVEREVNPRYYDLLQAFGKLTGVPVVLNTSFNVAGEPIVCTPEDALRCFYASGLDTLVVGEFAVKKD